MKLPRANFSTLSDGAEASLPEEEIGREPVALLTHDLVLSVNPDMVVVRVFSKGVTAAHIGLSPERAMKIGATFMRAALRIKPSLRNENITVIDGEAKGS